MKEQVNITLNPKHYPNFFPQQVVGTPGISNMYMAPQYQSKIQSQFQTPTLPRPPEPLAPQQRQYVNQSMVLQPSSYSVNTTSQSQFQQLPDQAYGQQYPYSAPTLQQQQYHHSYHHQQQQYQQQYQQYQQQQQQQQHQQAQQHQLQLQIQQQTTFLKPESGVDSPLSAPSMQHSYTNSALAAQVKRPKSIDGNAYALLFCLKGIANKRFSRAFNKWKNVVLASKKKKQSQSPRKDYFGYKPQPTLEERKKELQLRENQSKYPQGDLVIDGDNRSIGSASLGGRSSRSGNNSVKDILTNGELDQELRRKLLLEASFSIIGKDVSSPQVEKNSATPTYTHNHINAKNKGDTDVLSNLTNSYPSSINSMNYNRPSPGTAEKNLNSKRIGTSRSPLQKRKEWGSNLQNYQHYDSPTQQLSRKLQVPNMVIFKNTEEGRYVQSLLESPIGKRFEIKNINIDQIYTKPLSSQSADPFERTATNKGQDRTSSSLEGVEEYQEVNRTRRSVSPAPRYLMTTLSQRRKQSSRPGSTTPVDRRSTSASRLQRRSSNFSDSGLFTVNNGRTPNRSASSLPASSRGRSRKSITDIAESSMYSPLDAEDNTNNRNDEERLSLDPNINAGLQRKGNIYNASSGSNISRKGGSISSASTNRKNGRSSSVGRLSVGSGSVDRRKKMDKAQLRLLYGDLPEETVARRSFNWSRSLRR